MGIRQQNSTNYVHPDEPNLLNLHKALEYDGLGRPILRTKLGGSGSAVTDAFGRLRVSEPYTLWDSFHRYQDNGKANSYTATGGTISHDANSSSIVMSVTAASGSECIRESSRVFAYQPGKSLQVLQTFVMSEPKPGLRQRHGYFDVDNGFFLENDGGTVAFVKRSKSSGTVVETRVTRDQWIDPLDGTGASGISLDLSKAVILFTDIEWLGVGCVRQGFVINGEFVLAYQWNHANILTTAYMTTACLPVRSEITNTAATSGPSSLRIICTSVISEGGYELKGRARAVGHSLATPRTVSSGTVYPIFSMRLKSSRLGGLVLPKNFSIAVTGNVNYQYVIYTNAVTSGGTWIDAGSTDSSVEYNLTATSLVSGFRQEVGYIINSNQSSPSPALQETPFKYQLERNTFTNLAYEFVICLETTGSNQSAWASINWEEVT